MQIIHNYNSLIIIGWTVWGQMKGVGNKIATLTSSNEIIMFRWQKNKL